MSELRQETFIAAPPSVVFAYLLDPEKIVSWMGQQAETEPHVGGTYLVKGVGPRKSAGGGARGAFREVVPVHRLAYSFGWEGDAETPPASTLIELDLIDQDGGTLLRMTHSGFSTQAICDAHNRGWKHYLRRLSTAAAGGEPGEDKGPGGEM